MKHISFIPAVLIILVLIISFSACPTEPVDAGNELQAHLTLAADTISAENTSSYYASLELTLSWTPAAGAEDLEYLVYYSQSDNIRTLTDIRSNGTEITGQTSPFRHYGIEKDGLPDQLSVVVKGVEFADRIYFNIIASSVEKEESIAYSCVEAVEFETGTAILMESGEDYAYVINGYADIDNNHQTSMYADLPAAKSIIVGITNSMAVADDFYIEEVTKLSTRYHPSMSTGDYSWLSDTVASDNARNSRLIANMLPSLSRGSLPEPPLNSETVDTTVVSFNANPLTHDATLRYSKVVPTAFGDKTLKIWVENSSWITGGTEAYLTTDMVQQLGEKFLKTGSGNDIYDWVTNVYGEEWGTHSYGNLIGETDEINILLADLNADNSTTGGLFGFFWSKDNLTAVSESTSNERIMFYIDSLLFSQSDGGSWEITDSLPSAMVSTLGHEFQHMIGFYQTSIKRGKSQTAWVTELLSLATEDFLAEKLNIAGPRGYATPDGRASTAANLTSGRVPLFNLYTDTPRYTWLPSELDGKGMPYVLRSYSFMYAYGAYLSRNFGGPEFLREIMYNVVDEDDLMYLLKNNSAGENASSPYEIYHIPKFYLSVLLSDKIGLEHEYRFNNDGWFSYNLNGIDYKLPSLNFYNYDIKPYVFSLSGIEAYGNDLPPMATLLVGFSAEAGQTEVLMNAGDDDYGKSVFLLAR